MIFRQDKINSLGDHYWRGNRDLIRCVVTLLLCTCFLAILLTWCLLLKMLFLLFLVLLLTGSTFLCFHFSIYSFQVGYLFLWSFSSPPINMSPEGWNIIYSLISLYTSYCQNYVQYLETLLFTFPHLLNLLMPRLSYYLKYCFLMLCKVAVWPLIMELFFLIMLS